MAEEMDNALFAIIKYMQKEEFQEDIRHLLRYKEAHKTSSLSTLAPFLDERGILRVGGRTEAADIPYDAKHQMLLPYSHELTKLLLSTYHTENCHVGPQGLLAIIRQRFWPIKGKIIARSIVQHCIRCARAKPKLLSQMMGNLPATRVQPARPFINTGVDFCGPIWIHYKLRGKRPQKGYVAVFCCFATKAVHLEIVSDLSTEAFIGCLKRFMGRRGHCRNLYCDNATNFVGARNQLTELRDSIHSPQGQETISVACSQKGIDFHFIPPRAPHFGGLWEAAVKSAKHLLTRSIASASLTYEELETVIIEIEAILNSRPLIPLSSDPNDLTALTPGHFLIGEPLTAQVDAQAEAVKSSLLKRWKLVSHIKHEFWRRWSTEYLHELQYRFKWKQHSPNATPGMLVIIKDENTPPMRWPLGRIEKVYKGEDGHIRVVDVRTATGILRRPIHKLAPLPAEEEDTNTSEEITQSNCDEDIRMDQREKQLKRTTSDQSRSSNESPKKRTRTSLGSAVLTLLLTCLVLPLTKGELVEVTQFKPQLGIHFEVLGTTKLITKDWDLIVYYNLLPYWMEVNTLKNGTLALERLCQQHTLKSSCNQIIAQFQHLLDELNISNELLNPHRISSRVTRGAFNIVGTVANSLFGVLDQQYAEEMSKTINSIKGNEEHLLSLLRNNTSIVDSTINIVRKDEVEIAKKFNTLDNQISQIINRFSSLDEREHQTRIQQQFMSLSIQLTLITQNLQRLQSTIIDVITDTNHGRINPLLLSPHQLQKEISVIRNHLPTNLNLPTGQDNILDLYRLMSIKGRVTRDHVIFQIKIPLVNWETFDLLKVIPIPSWINNTMVAIEPHSPFLVTALHRDRYYPIMESELSSCLITEDKIHLCNQLHPIYHRGANVCACEMGFLNNAPNIEYCKLIPIVHQPVWLQLSQPNQWLFALNGNTSINIVCETELLTISLQGSGLLKVQPQCTIKEKFATIHGHQTYKTNIKTSYTRLGVSLDQIPEEKLLTVATSNGQYQSQAEALQHLQNRLAELDLHNLPHKVYTNSIHHFVISYLALGAVIVTTVYLIWRCREKVFKTYYAKPRPQPRQSKNTNSVIDV